MDSIHKMKEMKEMKNEENGSDAQPVPQGTALY
jgi:hypothetical protein